VSRVPRGAPASRRLIPVLALLTSAVAGCSSPAVGTYPEAPVVLVSIDTLRADRLSLYGYRQGSTPRLEGLGRESVVFDAAYSHCPLTLPSHASLFSGLLPPHHGVRDNLGFALSPAHRTLAARFKSAGWSTGAAVSAFVLRSPTGIAQGFDFYEDALEVEGAPESLADLRRDGAVAVEALARWVESQGNRRFFAFLHLYEPHAPCAPPDRYRALAQPYDGAVAYADELVGRFVDRLQGQGRLQRTVLAVVSDHGEGLKDHGEDEHGLLLYREALHVPLILRLPGGILGGTRVAGTVGTVDLAATLLDLAGLPADGLDGASLRPALGRGAAEARPVYSETLYPRYHLGWSDLYAVTEGRHRYIRAPHPELFDLETDPGERHNLADSKTSTGSALAQWLERRIGAVSAPEEATAEIREKLQALGYLGGGAVAPPAGGLPDPKDRIGAHEELKRALSLRQAGKDQEAIALFRRVLKENPRMLDAWEMLGFTLVRAGRTREGLAALHEGLAIDSLNPQIHLMLAKIYGLERNLNLASKHAELAAQRDPGEGYEVAAQLMMDRGDPARAGALARQSLAADPQRLMSHFILGVLAQKAGRYDEALGSFRKAEEIQKRQKGTLVRSLHANIGDCLARLGNEAEAEQEFRTEIKILPATREGRVGLATLYRSQRRDDEARAVLAGLVTAESPPSAETYWTVVHALSVLGDMEGARLFAGRAQARFPSDPRFRF
jgi:choline-sulfatase